MTPLVSNAYVGKHARSSAVILLTSLAGAISLFYLVLVRPFSAGFDLVSVGQGEGVKASNLVSETGVSVQNQLRALETFVLQGEYEGSLIRLKSIEQRINEPRPFVYGLDISGQRDEALILGLGRPGNSDKVYVFEDGIIANTLTGMLASDTLTIDQSQGTIETDGPTDFIGDDINFRAENGIRATQDGDIEIR